MVVVNLLGGLGNQLHMYAYALYLKQKYNYDVILDSSWFGRTNLNGFDCDNKERRKLDLDKFDIKIPIRYFSRLDKIRILPLGAKIRFITDSVLRKTFGEISINFLANKYLPNERTELNFDENMICILDHSYVRGYFTSYEYIRDLDLDLKFIGDMDSKNLDMLELIKNSKNSVALHIRRGDYLRLHQFIKLGIAYYGSAINIMNHRLKDCHYFIFSNDVYFARNEFMKYLSKSINRFTIVDINDDSNPACELYLMSRCNHQIIANSTFSFWAAMLNQNKDKIVIAPDRFLYTRCKEIFPKKWIIIDHLWGGGIVFILGFKKVLLHLFKSYRPSSSATLLP